MSSTAERWSWNSERAALLIIAAVVFLITLLVWQTGCLQAFDLALYDWFLAQRPKSAAADSPVTIIAITEEDTRRLGYPLSDQQLAELLLTLAAGQPRVVGLDIYRDLPEPRSGEESLALAAALQRLTNVIAIYRLGDSESSRIEPPPTLKAERIGFNNFPTDKMAGSKIRRGLLYAGYWEGTNLIVMESFGLQVAKHYLAAEAIWPRYGMSNPENLQLGLQEYIRLRPRDGGYGGADTDGYQCLLDFQGPSSFQTFNVSEAVGGSIPSEALRDRVVLIGSVMETVRDEHPSPLPQKVRGVEWHAQFIDQIIRRVATDQPPMRFVPEWMEILLVALATLLGLSGVWRGRSAWLLGLLVTGGLGALLGLNQWSLRHGRWIPVVPAGLALVGTAALSAVWSWQSQRRERQLLMKLFSVHVSPEIADHIWVQRRTFLEGRRPRPHLLTATVLFTDLRDFTTTVQQTEPARLMNWLSEYTDAMSQQILSRGGLIHEYVGDAILATFGVPVPRNSAEEVDADARAAVEAALGMACALEELNADWARRSLPTAEMRMGVDTGVVIGGSLGSQDRLKYAIVGDTVVAASRLESLDKGVSAADSPIPRCRILVSAATWCLGNGFVGRCLGPFVLKGRPAPVTIHHVFGQMKVKERL